MKRDLQDLSSIQLTLANTLEYASWHALVLHPFLLRRDNLRRLICHNCGSNRFILNNTYYQCEYCATRYIESKKKSKKYNYKYLFIILLLFFGTSLLVTNFLIDKKYLEIIKKITPTVTTKPWNLFYDEKKATDISSLELTKKGTYLLSGENSDRDVWISELDQNGTELWYKIFANNTSISHSLAIEVSDGYILSYQGSHKMMFKKNKQLFEPNMKKTIKLDYQHNILFQLPYYFISMIAVKDSFIGLTKTEIISVDRDGKYNIIHKTLALSKVVELNNKTFVAIGNEKGKGLKLINFSKEGNIIWNKTVPTFKISINDAVSTKDGGFILIGDTPIKIMKFSKNGELEWNKKIKLSKFSFGKTIEELKDGYLTTNDVFRDGISSLLIIKLDKDGNEVWERIHHNQHKHIHSTNLVKIKNEGYLVSISTEISSPWLVYMDKKGQINTNFSTVNYHINSNVIRNYKKEQKKEYVTNIFLKDKKNKWLKAITSLNKHYIYGLSDRDGLQIIDITNYDKPKLVSKFSLKVMKKNAKKVYNLSQDLIIDKKEKVAVIADKHRGVYFLDISNKKSPKIISILKDLKTIYSMVFSKNENKLYAGTNDGKIIIIDVSNLNRPRVEKSYSLSVRDNNYTLQNVYKVVLSKKKKNLLYVALENRLVFFDIKEGRKKSIYLLHDSIRDIVLNKNEDIIYIAEDKRIEVLSHANYNIEYIADIEINCSYLSAIALDEKGNKLYAGCSSHGVKVIDIKNRLNYNFIKEYFGLNDGWVKNISLSNNKKELIISYGVKGIGILQL